MGGGAMSGVVARLASSHWPRHGWRTGYTRNTGKDQPTMANVHDVAAYVLTKQSPISTMKLQKLCYYSQGWSLAWDSAPIFDEPIRAWANGPVVYELFKEHQGRFQVSDWPKGDIGALSDAQRETIDGVVASYGKLTGQQLSDKSHDERPWAETRGDLPVGAGSTKEIPLDLMQEYFSALAAHQ